MNRLLALVFLAAASTGVAAQGFPAKPIRVVIPFVAGGSSDIIGRAIANVPSVTEAGFPELLVTSWQAMVKALRAPDVFMQEELGRWTKVVQRGGITPD